MVSEFARGLLQSPTWNPGVRGLRAAAGTTSNASTNTTSFKETIARGKDGESERDLSAYFVLCEMLYSTV